MLADFAVLMGPRVRIAEIHSERHRAPPNGDSYKVSDCPYSLHTVKPRAKPPGHFRVHLSCGLCSRSSPAH